MKECETEIERDRQIDAEKESGWVEWSGHLLMKSELTHCCCFTNDFVELSFALRHLISNNRIEITCLADINE